MGKISQVKMALKKIVMIQPNSHRVYWGWYKYFDEHYDFTIILPKEGVTSRINFLKNPPIILDDKFRILNKIFGVVFSGSDISLKNLSKILDKLNPDIILVKIFYQNYCIEAYKWAKSHNKKFFIIEEMQSVPLNLFGRLIFYIYVHFLKLLFKKVPFICVTLNSYRFIKRLNFNATYIPVSFWRQDYKFVKHPQDKLRLLYVGRLTRIKNVEVVIKAIHYLLAHFKIKRDSLSFTIVGSGSRLSKYKKLIDKFNLKDIVNFLGYIENNKLDPIYNSHNVFILPSNPEPIGLVVLEAMYHSLPVICSCKAGGSSYVVDKKNGFLFEPKDYRDLAKKIMYYLDPKNRIKHGNFSLTLLKQKYDINKVGSMITTYIENS